MNLQYALDTLKQHKAELLSDLLREIDARNYATCRELFAGMLQIGYAIDVLEAAMGDGK